MSLVGPFSEIVGGGQSPLLSPGAGHRLGTLGLLACSVSSSQTDCPIALGTSPVTLSTPCPSFLLEAPLELALWKIRETERRPEANKSLKWNTRPYF